MRCALKHSLSKNLKFWIEAFMTYWGKGNWKSEFGLCYIPVTNISGFISTYIYIYRAINLCFCGTYLVVFHGKGFKFFYYCNLSILRFIIWRHIKWTGMRNLKLGPQTTYAKTYQNNQNVSYMVHFNVKHVSRQIEVMKRPFCREVGCQRRMSFWPYLLY